MNMEGSYGCSSFNSTVNNVLSNYASPDAAETTKYCSLMDTFYDIIDIRDANSQNLILNLFLFHFL